MCNAVNEEIENFQISLMVYSTRRQLSEEEVEEFEDCFQEMKRRGYGDAASGKVDRTLPAVQEKDQDVVVVESNAQKNERKRARNAMR